MAINDDKMDALVAAGFDGTINDAEKAFWEDGGIGDIPAATTTTIGGVKKSGTVTNLTDSSGGTIGVNTIAAIPAATAATTDITAASLTSTNLAITDLKNAVATLSAKVNSLLTALRGAGTIT